MSAPMLLRPEWLWLALALLPGVWLLSRLGAGRSPWTRLIDPALAAVVLDDGAEGRAGWPWGRTLVILGWLLALIVLAGPAWRQQPQAMTETADPVVVVLDLSLSMYAEDVPPSRLEVARFRIRDFLDTRRGGLTGLVAFAGDAHVVVPLSDDPATISNLLPALAPAMMPVTGSRAEDGVALALELLEGAGYPDAGAILLVTDEVVSPPELIASAGPVPVSVLAVGTPAGAPIPVPSRGQVTYLRDHMNQIIVPRLDALHLRDIAARTGGRYGDATLDGAGIAALIPHRDDDEAVEGEDERLRWYDDGVWLLLPLLLLVPLGFRRGVLFLLPLLLFQPQPAHAWSWRDLWVRPDQQGYEALRENRFDDALSRFEDPAWRGIAAHRRGDHDAAARDFSRAAGATADPDAAGPDTARALYNAGTALAHAGQFEAAARALTRSLELDPDHEDARHNLEIVTDLLEAQRQQQQDSQGDSGQDDPSEGDSSQRSEQEQSQSGEGDPSEQQDDARAGEPQDGEQGEQQQAAAQRDDDATEEGEAMQAEEAMNQEARDASEAWLRRIEDDPGGLLREKFRYESRLRQRAGRLQLPDQQW